MPKRKQAPTWDELMAATIDDVRQMSSGRDQLIPEVQELWEKVPFDIRNIPRFSVHEKALLALVFFRPTTGTRSTIG